MDEGAGGGRVEVTTKGAHHPKFHLAQCTGGERAGSKVCEALCVCVCVCTCVCEY